MTKQEKIQAGIKEWVLEIRQYLCNTEFAPEPLKEPVDSDVLTVEFPKKLIKFLDDNNVVIEVNEKIPYRWKIIRCKHSYSPYNEFTTYALVGRHNDMFGYIQKFQSRTGYPCFERPRSYTIFLGDTNYARSEATVKKLKVAKAQLIELFLEEKRKDEKIPPGYVAVESIIEESK